MRSFLLSACAIIVMATTACNSANSTTTQQDPAKGTSPDKSATATAAAQGSGAATPADPNTNIPEPTEGYEWAMRIDESERNRPAVLAYEVPETDDQPLSFTCEAGGRRIFAGIIGGPANLNRITLTTGDQTLRLSGRTEATEIPEMPSFTSQEIASDSPFMRAFTQNGWLRLTADGRTTDMASADTKGALAIANFIAHCNESNR